MQNINVNELLNAEELKELGAFAQVIPTEMMQKIVAAAKTKNISVEIEILSRFLATITKPQEFGFKSNVEVILKKEFSADDAVEECKRNREHSLYVYEVEKLRLFLMFQAKIPRRVKEKFMVIDVKEETKRILVEMKANDAKNKNDNNEGKE